MTIAASRPKMIVADAEDPRIQAALAELQDVILRQFPDTMFTITHGDDPDGIYLKPKVDVDDLDPVADVVVRRLLDMQVEEGLPIYVIPIWPDARIDAYLLAKRAPSYGAVRTAATPMASTVAPD